MNPELFRLHSEIEQRHWWFVARRSIMRSLIHRVLEPDPQHVLIDVGCGTGGNIASLTDEYHCIGIDPTEQAIDLASARFPKAQFIHGFAPENLGELAARAKLFLLMDVLEHVRDDFELFSGLVRASSPGAHFLVTVPANPALWSQHDRSFGHFRRYTRSRLERVWAGLPVRVRLLSYFNSRLYPVVRAIRWLSEVRGRASGREGSDLAMPSPAINRALAAIFAGETSVLDKALSGRPGYERGVSLVALLQREDGEVQVRGRPADIESDLFDPQTMHDTTSAPT